MIGRAAGQAEHLATVHDHSAAEQPRTIGAARSPGPAAADQIIATLHRRPPHRREHAASDDVRIEPDFPRVFHGQPCRNQRRGAADHHAPAGGGIGTAQLFKAGEQGGDIHLRPAQRLRHQHAEQAGLRQFRRQIGR